MQTYGRVHDVFVGKPTFGAAKRTGRNPCVPVP